MRQNFSQAKRILGTNTSAKNIVAVKLSAGIEASIKVKLKRNNANVPRRKGVDAGCAVSHGGLGCIA
jgi:hypothetical protein